MGVIICLRNRVDKPVSNRFRIFRLRAIDWTNLKPVLRIQANLFGDSLVERSKIADGEPKRVALSCAPVRALLRTHGLEATLMQVATLRPRERSRGSTPVGASRVVRQ